MFNPWLGGEDPVYHVAKKKRRKMNKLRQTSKSSLKIINQTDTQGLDLHDLFDLASIM